MSASLPHWYHGDMEAEEATAICCKVGQNGSFLVRESQGVKGALTLSMFFKGEVYHHRLGLTNGKYFVLGLETKVEFDSLEKLVDYYMAPHEEFMHPLTVAIYPSLVKQFYADDKHWSRSIRTSTPLYDIRGSSTSSTYYTPVLKPNVPPKPESQESYYEDVSYKKSPKSNELKIPTSILTASPSTKAASTSSKLDEESWPAPPPPLYEDSTSPEVKPKPQSLVRSPLHRLRSNSCESKSNNVRQSQVTSSQVGKAQSFSRGTTARPRWCVFPSTESNLVCDIPGGLGEPSSTGRGRTLSVDKYDEIKNDQNPPQIGFTGHKQENVSPSKPAMKTLSTDATKSGHNKKSRLKTFAHFISRIHIVKSKQASQNVVLQKPENVVLRETREDKDEVMRQKEKLMEEREKTHDNGQVNNNQDIADDYTPILCKTQFVTTTDYIAYANELNFTKGTEMAVKGVRADGWWYCLNKSTKEFGWVYMDYLKPTSGEKWFEAKPVETTQDYELYDSVDFESDFDSDSDDDNYCRYVIPLEDAYAGNVDKSEPDGNKVTIGTF